MAGMLSQAPAGLPLEPDSRASTKARAVARGSTRVNRPAIRTMAQVEHLPPVGSVYAVTRGHRTIFRSPHNP